MNIGDARTDINDGRSELNDVRGEILRSIRTHLAASPPVDRAHDETDLPFVRKSPSPKASPEVVQRFKHNLELVDGHCIIAQNDTEVAEVVKRITEGKGIAVSSETYRKEDLFSFDVGITSAQAGIAETGTLVLDSSQERNRLVSLVPPVHIAILDASKIFLTLGETLASLQSGAEVSPSVTFITGPSRTADIELTLALGVHGPQELYVIINEASLEAVGGMNNPVVGQ